ncbi:MAG: 3-isopropylmalate dehydrogenase, partial [Treponemataceae bacterium]|nr:3-isopropylmalate dehydrogenase [Treponemataceae bacterium]
MERNIALIPGDGIGPDVVAEGVKVLDAVAAKFGHSFSYTEVIAGGAAIDKWGHPLPQDQLDICLRSDAVLLGALGGPKWDNVAPEIRPEKGLLGLRGGLKVYANLRPAVMWKQLKDACPLKDEIVGDGLDILVVRELTGGIYFGERGMSADGKTAWDTEKYTWEEIERIVRMGFTFAQKRQKRLAVVDKANILNSSRLWRTVAEKVHEEFKDVQLDFLYIDNAAMQLVRNPRQFDVIATSNMFGDILTDEASQITGSIGMLASASLGDGTGPGLYEPIHGSAPDIAGKDIANPLATILSVAMLLRYSFALEAEAKAIEQAVHAVLDEGWRTGDIAGT